MQNKTYWIARNIITGLYYSLLKGAFVAHIDDATLLDATDAVIVKYSFENAFLVEVL